MTTFLTNREAFFLGCHTLWYVEIEDMFEWEDKRVLAWIKKAKTHPHPRLPLVRPFDPKLNNPRLTGFRGPTCARTRGLRKRAGARTDLYKKDPLI